jgi:hypothetical protein
VTERDADDDGCDHLQIEALVERLVRRARSIIVACAMSFLPRFVRRPGVWSHRVMLED